MQMGGYVVLRYALVELYPQCTGTGTVELFLFAHSLFLSSPSFFLFRKALSANGYGCNVVHGPASR
jgi:hypothetical protein